MKPHKPHGWTEAKVHSFIKNALRNASLKWPCRNHVKKRAHVSRGRYRCTGYEVPPHTVKSSYVENGKRINNVFIDHKDPVVPVTGFDSWDEVIARMFCSRGGLQLLCKSCHDRKTKDEKVERIKHNKERGNAD